MPRTDDITPPARRARRCLECKRVDPFHAEDCAIARALDESRCRDCGFWSGHAVKCPVAIRSRRTAELKMHATRHWVRAVIVKAAERTMRGPAVCWFVQG
jgi:hypothetical protein